MTAPDLAAEEKTKVAASDKPEAKVSDEQRAIVLEQFAEALDVPSFEHFTVAQVVGLIRLSVNIIRATEVN